MDEKTPLPDINPYEPKTKEELLGLIEEDHAFLMAAWEAMQLAATDMCAGTREWLRPGPEHRKAIARRLDALEDLAAEVSVHPYGHDVGRFWLDYAARVVAAVPHSERVRA